MADKAPNRVDGAVLQLLQRLAVGLENPTGPVLAHLQNLGNMPPSLYRLDNIRFDASIATNGSVSQPTNVRVNPDFDTEVFGMVGYMQAPSADFSLLPYVTFSIEETGRGFKFFTSDFNMAALVPTTGVGGPYLFDRGGYVVPAGGELKCTFSTTSAYTGAAADKIFGIQLLCCRARASGAGTP